MEFENETRMDHINSASMQVSGHQILDYALKAGFFIWHYFEMMLAMGVGATLFELLVRKMPASTSYAFDLQPGTFLYIIGISLSMMLVMITWMIVRGHGWRHSAEMSVAMLLPVTFVAVSSMRQGNAAWFQNSYCSAMCLGMLTAMLYRWDHFTRWSFSPAHHGH